MLLSVTLAAGLLLATRPPYTTRQLQLGLAYCEQGKYALAVDCLNDAILANPASSEALFARGRAFQRLGKFEIASQDYNSAYQLKPSGVLKACEGYCLSQIKYHRHAITAYHSALEGDYDSPAILYSNIGFIYLMLGQLGDAEEYLQRALHLDDNLQAAHYNMVIVFLQRALQGQRAPEAAFTHATRALETGPCAADLYHAVATLYAMAAKEDSALIQPAIEYVGKAVQLGRDPKEFTSNPSCATLQKEPTFRDALQRPVLPQKSPKGVQLVDPLNKP
jgi:Tfp pilus assembly protein PilF